MGIVVSDLDRAAAEYAAMGFRPAAAPVHDLLQRVHILLLSNGNGPGVELIKAAAEDSPVAAFVRRGGGINHVCYEVPDLEAAVDQAMQAGALCVAPPMPAIAFDGRRVSFVFFSSLGLVEMLEVGAPT